jgi:hypothetical protein
MGRPTPETGGGASQNQGLSEFKPLAKERGVGWSVKKSEEPKEQPSDSRWESYDRFFRKGPMQPAVFEGLPPRRQNVEGHQPTPQKPSEERGGPEAVKPNPAEQQARERLAKPPPKEYGEVLETLDPEVEEAIQAYAMGDSEEEAQLREQVKNDPNLRDGLLHPGSRSLASSAPDLTILRIFRKPEDSS